jgi:ferredoxin
MTANTVDRAVCTGCGACVTICPHRVIELEAGTARTAPGRGRHCVRCAQCVAVCPEGAMGLPWLEPEQIVPLEPHGFGAEAFRSFLYARRSVRVFADRPVERALIERVLEAAATAPMGFPPHTTEVLVIDRREELDHLRQRCLEAYRKLVREYRSPLVRQIMRLNVDADLMTALGNHVVPAVENNNALHDERGEDRYLYGAPALLLFHAARSATKYDENAVIVATHALLAAHALGLGATMLGIIPPVVNKHRGLRERLGLPRGNVVVSSLILGHPAVAYHRGVRRPLRGIRYL